MQLHGTAGTKPEYLAWHREKVFGSERSFQVRVLGLMRAAFLPFLFIATALMAQPGWRPLAFSFILLHKGAEVPAAELGPGKAFILEAQGDGVRPLSYSGSRFSTVTFSPDVSDLTMHRDTLWLRIRHRREGVMAIGFPPRIVNGTMHRYSTNSVVVPFAAGRVLVTELPKELHVTGEMHGLGMPWQARPSYALAAHCGCDTVKDAATWMKPTMDFTLQCHTEPRDGLEQTELVFFTRGGPYEPGLNMVVRGNVGGGHWPLDTVVFTPTRFVKGGGRPLEPDDAGPRDLVLGIHAYGNWFRISPVNPAPGAGVRFTLQWLGGGERLSVSHVLELTDNDTAVIVLTVQRERFETDPRPQYHLNAVAHEVPSLRPGLYRLRLVYADDPARPVPRFPQAEGFLFRVADHVRP